MECDIGVATMIAVQRRPIRCSASWRRNDTDKVFVAINFSDRAQTVNFQDTLYHGKYVDYFSGQMVGLNASTKLNLKPWGYQVLWSDPRQAGSASLVGDQREKRPGPEDCAEEQSTTASSQ